MITDLTALDIANASLLDEGTAAAEAMTLCRASVGSERSTFFVANNCHPQTIEIIQTRAKPLGVRVIVGDFSNFKFDDTVFGALVQYPATEGAIFDYESFAKAAHDAGALLVVAADILALTLLKPPGEFGADERTCDRVFLGERSEFGEGFAFRFCPGQIQGVIEPDVFWNRRVDQFVEIFETKFSEHRRARCFVRADVPMSE